jgi:2-succinyl-6-hydroxy-2,4-cyclohexadiene-1-carboxylate synthase
MSEPLEWTSVAGPLACLRAGSGPRIVFVHGFTQTGRSWIPISQTFTVDHEVILVDAPGHGGSGDVRVDLPDGAELIGEVGGPAMYVGYSMGARFLLHLALVRPDLVRALVLLGGTGGLTDERERSQRRAADDALADEIEQIGVDAFLQRWLALPLFATLPDDAKGLADRACNTASGLASSLRLAGLGTQLPLWDRLRSITAPTLALAGDLDTRFVSLGKQIAVAIGDNAQFRTVDAAGHAAHLEHPSAVIATVREWMTVKELNPRQRLSTSPTVAKTP